MVAPTFPYAAIWSLLSISGRTIGWTAGGHSSQAVTAAKTQEPYPPSSDDRHTTTAAKPPEQQGKENGWNGPHRGLPLAVLRRRCASAARAPERDTGEREGVAPHGPAPPAPTLERVVSASDATMEACGNWHTGRARNRHQRWCAATRRRAPRRSRKCAQRSRRITSSSTRSGSRTAGSRTHRDSLGTTSVAISSGKRWSRDGKRVEVRRKGIRDRLPPSGRGGVRGTRRSGRGQLPAAQPRTASVLYGEPRI